jgi:type I restriction enzyme S subunit
LSWQKLYEAGIFFNFESKTTGLKNLMFDSFVSAYHFATPPDSILTAFDKIVSPIFCEIQKKILESSELLSLRDFLLPLLMNGQVTISKTEVFI